MIRQWLFNRQRNKAFKEEITRLENRLVALKSCIISAYQMENMNVVFAIIEIQDETRDKIQELQNEIK